MWLYILSNAMDSIDQICNYPISDVTKCTVITAADSINQLAGFYILAMPTNSPSKNMPST